MEWSKLKNIILLLLLLTNLCLLFFVVQQEFQREQQQRQARTSALTFLAERGVQAREDQIPREMTLLPQTVERDLTWEYRAAAALLGEAVQADPRGGEVYRYESSAGAIQFHSDGAFSAEFAPGALPLGEDWEKGCRAYLADMEFQGQLLEREGDRFTFRQLWEGAPLFSQQVTLVCQDGCLVGMAGGRRLAGQPQPDLSRTPITVPTALFGFLNGLSALGDVCSRIDAVEEGYVAAVSLPGPTVLTPVWHITTDTGAYQLDTLTGEVTRVS